VNKRQFDKKIIAWSLIAAILNPAAVLPAYGRDSDIYLSPDPAAVAATVPISVLNRAQNATDIYLAFFQPGPSSASLGTVKKFNLSTDPTDCGTNKTPCLIGQTVLTKSSPNPSPVKNIENVTGDSITRTQSIVIDPNASSLWAPPSITDGGRPDQGGTGYQLINTAGYDPSTRNLYTFISGTSSTVDLTAESNAVRETNPHIDKCRLGGAAACANPAASSMSDATRATLINFVRGGNPSDRNCSDANPATACTTWRAWPHAAVEHSKPVIVTYDATPTGTPARPTSQYLYFLSNDGLLHAVDAFTGKEKWAFLIEEALPQINALMDAGTGPQHALAGGALSIYQTDDNGDGIVNAGDKVWLYFGLRRGGRAYYALDITLKDAPRFKWKITAYSGSGQLCAGTGACAANADYNELGQTWSAPIVGKIRALGASVPALIFGGGYDPNQDLVPPAGTADTIGRAVYVVNGETGAAVRWFGSSGSVAVAGMNFSIPSDVTALNTDSDAQGFIDRLYVGDTGGNVWRFDIDSATLTSWTGKKLADLSGDTTPRRKIFLAPAAVKRDVPERFDAVYVGTGDREHPLNTQVTAVRSARDAIFMIMDREVGLSSGPAVATYPMDFALIANDCLSACVALGELSSKKGWARDLETNCAPNAAGIARCGEKVVSPPTVFNLKLRFGTYAPTAASHAFTPSGEGRMNEIDAVTGDLANLNTASGLTAADRYYASTGRGYPSASVVIVLGRNAFLVTVLDGVPKFQRLGTTGNATKIYWYMEIEE